ncbi:MAG: hypothetical protein ACRC3H_13090 [Lachnospiraceae bacterium]
MRKEELGQLICYLWSNADQAQIMDSAEYAFRNCPVRVQMELLDIFTAYVKENPRYWLDKPERVRATIEKAEKLLDK